MFMCRISQGQIMQGFHNQKGGFCFVSGVCFFVVFVLKDNRADKRVVYSKKKKESFSPM